MLAEVLSYLLRLEFYPWPHHLPPSNQYPSCLNLRCQSDKVIELQISKYRVAVKYVLEILIIISQSWGTRHKHRQY